MKLEMGFKLSLTKKIGVAPSRINFMACDSWRDVALFMVTPVP